MNANKVIEVCASTMIVGVTIWVVYMLGNSIIEGIWDKCRK